MAFLSDSVTEFKKLPTGGKIAIGAIFVGVAALGYYAYRKGGTGIGTSSPAASVTPGVQGLPSFPFGTTALTDSSGNPVAFINPPAPGPTVPAPRGPAPAPSLFETFFGPSGEKVYNASMVPGLGPTKTWLGGTDIHGQRVWFTAPGIKQGLYYTNQPTGHGGPGLPSTRIMPSQIVQPRYALNGNGHMVYLKTMRDTQGSVS